MTRQTINVYKEWPAETGSLRPCLAETFAGTDVKVNYIGRDEILDRSAFADPRAVIVLPGAPDGNGYRDQLGGEGFKLISDHVANGGGVLTICASTYMAMKTYSYRTDGGTLKEYKSDLALVNGHAHGPLTELFDPEKRWGGRWAQHAIARLIFNEKAGQEVFAGVCYSRGPLLKLNEPCRIVSTFRDVAGHPPAIISKKIGEGIGVFSAVSIEIDGEMMRRMVSPEKKADAHGFASELARFQASRDEIWAHIWNDLFDMPTARPAPRRIPS